METVLIGILIVYFATLFVVVAFGVWVVTGKEK